MSDAARGMSQQQQSISIRIGRRLSDIEALRDQWEDLARRDTGAMTYFQTVAWCEAWARQFCARRGGPRLLIVSAWRGDALAAVLPLMQTGHGLGIRHLRPLGEPHTQYAGLLRDPALFDAEMARAIGEAVLRHGSCDVAVFPGVPQDSPLNAVLDGTPVLAGYDNRAAVLDLMPYSDADDYFAGLSKLQKRNRNRRRNHLGRLGALDFAVLWPGDPEFAALLRMAIEMKRTWLRHQRRISLGLSAAGHDAFLASLEGDSGRREGACLSVLRVGGRPVAIELGFIDSGHYYAYLGGFDWALRDLSPGKVQMEMTVGWLIENGVGAYDLLGNGDAYKSSWSNRDVPLRAYARAHTPLGHLYSALWLPTIRPAIKRMHRAIPDMMRRLVQFGQGLTCLLLYV